MSATETKATHTPGYRITECGRVFSVQHNWRGAGLSAQAEIEASKATKEETPQTRKGEVRWSNDKLEQRR